MKRAAFTFLTMIAFAANSLLNRAALATGAIDPGSFASIRVVSGAVMLLLLLTVSTRAIPRPPKFKPLAALSLTAYLVGFSFAYVALDAGAGALILFGGVQLTMFSGALIEGDRPPVLRWVGMVLSLVGLFVLFQPGQTGGLSLLPVILMALAALGWGLYSLLGRGVTHPLAATAWNFVYAVPLVLLVSLLHPAGSATQQGFVLAVLSGAVTSGLGYALWYALLPGLGATRAALWQLSVPVIALIAGAIFLGEVISARAVLASVLVLGGIALGLVRSRSRQDGA